MLRTQDKRLEVHLPLGQIAMKEFRPNVLELVGDEGISHGITVAANAAANTKGSWILLGTTAIDCDGFYLQVVPGTSSNSYLVDIGTGAAAAEVAILSNMLFQSASVGNWVNAEDFYVPLPLPAGTRITARCQSGTAGSDEIWVSMVPARGTVPFATRMAKATTYGAVTGSSRGTQMDPGGTANTNGTPAELSAAITDRIDYALAFVSKLAGQTNNTASWFTELMIGAGGSETMVVPGLQSRLHDSADVVLPNVHSRYATWPSGARLSARCRCSINTVTSRLLDAVVIGFTR